jgi:predicted DNA-binding protein (UPF0251 family)
MDSYTTITIVVAVMVILGSVIGLIFFRRKRSDRFQAQYGTEYTETVKNLGDNRKAQTELEKRQKHINSLHLRTLTVEERERYLAEWAEVQSKFVNDPGQAIMEADRLIIEVMRLRDYPISDFEERAADISIQYPALVSDYRAARKIMVKNMDGNADTEELRIAAIQYRSVFDELIKPTED